MYENHGTLVRNDPPTFHACRTRPGRARTHPAIHL